MRDEIRMIRLRCLGCNSREPIQLFTKSFFTLFVTTLLDIPVGLFTGNIPCKAITLDDKAILNESLYIVNVEDVGYVFRYLTRGQVKGYINDKIPTNKLIL